MRVLDTGMELRKFRLVRWITGDFGFFIFSKDEKEIEFFRPIKKKEIHGWKDLIDTARNQGFNLSEWDEYKANSPSDKIWEEWCHPYFYNIHWVIVADNVQDYIPQNKW